MLQPGAFYLYLFIDFTKIKSKEITCISFVQSNYYCMYTHVPGLLHRCFLGEVVMMREMVGVVLKEQKRSVVFPSNPAGCFS